MTITYIIPAETVDAPLWWHGEGLSFTASGYGARIPSRHKVRLEGEKILRRVYVTIYSNAGSAWIMRKGVKFHIA